MCKFSTVKVLPMNHDQVRDLEELIEAALATVFRQREAMETLSHGPPPPDDRTLHLMAKAAVTVFEATDRRRR